MWVNSSLLAAGVPAIIWEILKQFWPVIVAFAIFLAGYKYARYGEERRELEAKLDQEIAIKDAQSKVLYLERQRAKRKEELDEVFKSNDNRRIADFANKLLRKIFKGKGKSSS